MITELAQIEIQPGQEAAFEAAAVAALGFIRRAAGCVSVDLHRGIERPTRYFLVVAWESLQHHTIGFRQSADFGEWRRLITPFLAGPPEVEHMALAVAGA